ncbi:MAG: 16S rRNA (cytosine(1402)-N(4))-methyltransferase RsmH [Patescibacteria group bacterium]|nr:16S rRNA (cytosine(1402)-N(4))-methyltransferase RsmH [Patescibacteria group bacterium]
MRHNPVLLNEVLEILNPKPGDFIIDGTINGGGHSAAILGKIGKTGKLLGIDIDTEMIKKTREKIASTVNFQLSISNLILTRGNYSHLPEILKKHKLSKADGLLLDLGFSSGQLNSDRGFSFLKDEVLDMRYDMRNNAERFPTAAEIINSLSESELADIFYKYGEERFSRRIAKAIVEERKKRRIMTTLMLAEIVKKAVPRGYERGRIHPATRVFQALRIYVNKELENLESILKNLKAVVKPKGRVAIISFHSLEDRMVKNCFRDMKREGTAEIITKKPITAAKEEILKNPRSRSAKLRVIQLATSHQLLAAI